MVRPLNRGSVGPRCIKNSDLVINLDPQVWPLHLKKPAEVQPRFDAGPPPITLSRTMGLHALPVIACCSSSPVALVHILYLYTCTHVLMHVV